MSENQKYSWIFKTTTIAFVLFKYTKKRQYLSHGREYYFPINIRAYSLRNIHLCFFEQLFILGLASESWQKKHSKNSISCELKKMNILVLLVLRFITYWLSDYYKKNSIIIWYYIRNFGIMIWYYEHWPKAAKNSVYNILILLIFYNTKIYNLVL